MQRFPSVESRARSMRRWYARVEHKELWAVIVILLSTNVLFWFGSIVGWSSPDQPYMSTHMRPVPPTDMQLVLNKGGWRVSVSPTLVESNLTVGGCNIPNFQFGMLYIRSSLHSIFYCILANPRKILSNSKTLGESWGFFRYSNVKILKSPTLSVGPWVA